MKPRSILLLVIPLLVSSCGNNSESTSFSSESSSSVISSSESVSSSTSISESSSTSSVESSLSSSEESESSAFTYSGRSDPVPSKAVYTTNPMNEPLIHNQYYLNHIGDIYNTWKYYRGKGVTIAVIDIGFKYNHEDFTYSNGKSKVSSLSAAFTSNINKSTGEYETKTVVGANKTAPNDANESHGTFCAGVAAAGLNGKGVVGIAPEAELMLLKTDAKPRSIDAAFRYAADKGAKVVTISIGSYSDYDGDLVKDDTNLEEAFVDAVKYCRE